MGRRDQQEPTGTEPENYSPPVDHPVGVPWLEWAQSFESLPEAYDIAWSADGKLLAATGPDGEVTIWSPTDGIPRYLEGHDRSKFVMSLAWHPNRSMLATGSNDGTVRFWDVDAGVSHRFCTLNVEVKGVAWSPDGNELAVTEEAGGIGIWDVRSGVRLKHVWAHGGTAYSPCWAADGRILAACIDRTIVIHAASDLRLVRRLSGHSDVVWDIALSPGNSLIASASDDETIRVWDLSRGTEIAVLEGHTGLLRAIQFSPTGEFLASASKPHQAREPSEVLLWRCRDWEPVAFLSLQASDGIGGLAFHPTEPLLTVKELKKRQIDFYSIDYALLDDLSTRPESRRYTNAKVVLLGDTGVGKSGLGLVLSGQPYEPTDSTHGRNVWTVDAEEIQVPGGGTQTRELLLWDLAGQPGYRLIHQLHLNEVVVALIVFDSRSEIDPFSGVKYWARALAQARRLEGSAAVPMNAYLVAARADRGGVGVSAERVRAPCRERSTAALSEPARTAATPCPRTWYGVDSIAALPQYAARHAKRPISPSSRNQPRRPMPR